MALRVPDEVRERIATAQSELRATLARNAVRWTRPEQFHVTLKFLGDVDVTRINELRAAVESSISRLSAFQLNAEGIGFLPKLRRARVVWAGVTSPGAELGTLFQVVQQAAQKFSNEINEEKFSGHITLGLVKTLKGGDAKALETLALKIVQNQFGKWIAQSVELMRSELSAAGAVHTLQARFPLIPHQGKGPLHISLA